MTSQDAPSPAPASDDELMDCYQYGTVPSPAPAEAEIVERLAIIAQPLHYILEIAGRAATEGDSKKACELIARVAEEALTKLPARFSAIRPIIEEKARESEREKCAKVAEEFRHPNPFPTVYGAIAAAIRSRTPATGGETS